MRENCTSGATREGITGLTVRPLYSTVLAVQNTRGKFHSLNGPAAAGGGADLKLHLGDVELKRQGAKIAKGFIVENKRFLGAFASLRFKTLVASFTL